MTSIDTAEALGRRFDHIVRARWSLGALHFALGFCSFCLINGALRAEMWDDWWFRPLRFLHLQRVPLFSPPWFILLAALLGPPLVYLASWSRVKDSLLEDTHGATFWLAGGGYVFFLTIVSIASDWLCLWAIQPPLCFSCLIGAYVATLAMLRALAEVIDRITENLVSA
jgi:hypothetical protein